jgi:hypothetical protein
VKSLVLCNQLGRLKSILTATADPFRYLSLVENREGRKIREYLKQIPNAEELPKNQLFRDRSEAFRHSYVEFMGNLNKANHSARWWPMLFTSKNPDATTLCRNTAEFLLIVDLLHCDSKPLLVITDNSELVDQARAFARTENLEATFLVTSPGTMRKLLKVHTPGGALRAAFRTFLVWLLCRKYRLRRSANDAHLVIASLTYPRSFPVLNGYRDPYFGALVDHVASSSGNAMVLALLVDQPFQQLKQLRDLEFGIPVVPLESYLTLRDLVSCTLWALLASLWPRKLKGLLEINGVDVGCLVKGAFKDGRHSGEFFLNLRVFYATRWLVRQTPVVRCIYPFENRPWEKMLLLGMNSASTETQLAGYQHASLTKAHTNFMMGDQEAQITPLPQTILTTGEVATTWLKKETNLPPEIFKTASALRQGNSTALKEKNRSPDQTRAFVALATSLEEYVGALSFLEKAFAGTSKYQVRIRPHPELASSLLESALTIAPLTGPPFYSESTGSLTDDLDWADVVLYVSSTVGMEAISVGIPAVNIDLGDFLNRDPLSGWDEFKWTAEQPSELPNAIDSIWELPQTEFKRRQQIGREYIASYLSPVETEKLGAFVDF